jgi:hypothetical protein
MAKKPIQKTKNKAKSQTSKTAVKKQEVIEAEVIKLTPKQEKFCELFASDREFFGNGTQSYIEAYAINMNRPGAYNVAQAAASRLLANLNVLKRIDELMEVQLSNVHVDKQLGFWITQKASPQASVAAIKEYNQLKGRIVKKIEGKFEGDVNIALVEFVGDDDDAEEDNTNT